MITLEQLKLVSSIEQYQLYLDGRCVTFECLNKPKLYYESNKLKDNSITAWSLCETCKTSRQYNYFGKFKEYSEKELFTISILK